MQYEEKGIVPTTKDGENKESHKEKIFILSIYIIIVVEGRVSQLTEGRDGMIVLKCVSMSQICE
jgi:hypothetical protein